MCNGLPEFFKSFWIFFKQLPHVPFACVILMLLQVLPFLEICEILCHCLWIDRIVRLHCSSLPTQNLERECGCGFLIVIVAGSLVTTVSEVYLLTDMGAFFTLQLVCSINRKPLCNLLMLQYWMPQILDGFGAQFSGRIDIILGRSCQRHIQSYKEGQRPLTPTLLMWVLQNFPKMKKGSNRRTLRSPLRMSGSV